MIAVDLYVRTLQILAWFHPQQTPPAGTCTPRQLSWHIANAYTCGPSDCAWFISNIDHESNYETRLRHYASTMGRVARTAAELRAQELAEERRAVLIPAFVACAAVATIAYLLYLIRRSAARWAAREIAAREQAMHRLREESNRIILGLVMATMRSKLSVVTDPLDYTRFVKQAMWLFARDADAVWGLITTALSAFELNHEEVALIDGDSEENNRAIQPCLEAVGRNRRRHDLVAPMLRSAIEALGESPDDLPTPPEDRADAVHAALLDHRSRES